MIFLTLHPVDRGFAVRKPVCLQGCARLAPDSSGKIKIRPSIRARGVLAALKDSLREPKKRAAEIDDRDRSHLLPR